MRKSPQKFDLIFLAIVSIVGYKLIQDKDVLQGNITKYFTPILHMSPRNAQDFIQFISISPIFYMVYFILGIYFVLYYDKVMENIVKFKNIIIVLFIILFIPRFLIIMHDEGMRISFHFSKANTTNFTIAYNICSIFLWYYISILIAKKMNKLKELLRIMSHYSFTSYLYHVFVINTVVETLTRYYKVTPKNYIFPSVVYCITTIILAPILSHLFASLPYSKYIFGCTRYEFKNKPMQLASDKLKVISDK